MTRRPDDQMTILTRWPYWPDDQMTIWPYWQDGQIIRKQEDQMTIWQDDQMTRWQCWPDDQITNIMMIYDDLTIMMYRNIIKNNSNPLPPKASPEPPKLARHLPYQIQWWYMMIWPYWCIETSSKTTVTHCLQKCHHCTRNWHVISHTRYNDDIWWSDHNDV